MGATNETGVHGVEGMVVVPMETDTYTTNTTSCGDEARAQKMTTVSRNDQADLPHR